MKKRTSILLIALVIAVLFAFGASACNTNDAVSITENDLVLYYKETADGETSIFSKAENYNSRENRLELTLQVEDSEYDFNAHFKTPTGQKWKLYADREGREQIATKIVVDFKNGENLFYLVVFDKNETYQKTFVVRIEKKYLVSLTFLKRDGSKMNVFDQKFTDFIAGSNGEIDQSSQVILPGGTTLANLPLYEEEKGYEFRGWLCEQFVVDSPVTNDLTFIPDIHAKTFDCELDVAGGFIADGTNKVTLTFDKADVLPVPSRTGYVFKGWKSDNLGGIFTDENGNMLAPLTKELKNEKFTAEWEAKTITLTFDSNGGSAVNPVTAKFGTDVPAIAEPVKEGYTFTGWTPAVPKTMPAEDMSFVAGWKINRHTISFDTDGGNTISPITQDYGTAIAAPANPVKKGYTFKEWSPAVPETMPDRDVTVTAKWTINKYVVSFDLAGGKIDGKETYEIEQNYNTKVAAPQNPVKTGYTFLGWLNAKGAEQTFPFTLDAENVTLTANWKINTYKLTYKYDIEGKNDDVFDMHYGDEISHVSAPSKTGYEFRRWWATDDNQYATMPDHDVTFVAQWTVKQFTITFDYAGGTLDGQNSYTITADYGSAVTAPGNPLKEKYTFKGWTRGGVDSDIVSVMPAYDVTYTAKWQINESTITYLNDGAQYATRKGNVGDAVDKPENPVKKGYTFKGWSANHDVFPNENVTVEAVWQVNRYNLVYIFNNGSGNTTEPHDYGSTIVPIENPTKLGYDFDGWKPALPETMPDENVTVTAQWKIHTHDVVFDAAGGKINGEGTFTKQYDFGANVTAPSAPVRTGYSFDGWYTAEDKKQSFPFKLDDAGVTLTAKWTINKYTITFALGGGNIDGKTAYSITQDYGTAVTAPANPVRDGYEFTGWSQDVPEYMPAENITITAGWKKKINITLNSNGGFFSGGGIIKTIGDVMTDTKNLDLGKPESREHYTFIGWATSANGATIVSDENGVCASIPDVSGSSLTLWAAWKPIEYTITLKAKDGQSAYGRFTINGVSTTTIKATIEDTVIIKAVANIGYDFVKWTIDGNDYSVAEYTLTKITKNTTAVATFKMLNGTPISTEGELRAIADNPSDEYYLTKDITLSSEWTPIASFSGTLDGKNYKISGVRFSTSTGRMEQTGDKGIGLFCEISASGIVKNLTLNVNMTIKTYEQQSDSRLSFGAIAGTNYGLVENCKVTGNMNALSGKNVSIHYLNYLVGGAVGFNMGVVKAVNSSVVITVTDACDGNYPQSGMYVGGVVGLHGMFTGKEADMEKLLISDCYAGEAFTVTSTNKVSLFAGQAVGAAYAPINDIKTAGKLTVKCVTNTANLSNAQSVKNQIFVGGIAGVIGGETLTRTYSSTEIVVDATGNARAGGICNILSRYGVSGGVTASVYAGTINVQVAPTVRENGVVASALIGKICAYVADTDKLGKLYYLDSATISADCTYLNAQGAETEGAKTTITEIDGAQVEQLSTNATATWYRNTLGFGSDWVFDNNVPKLTIELN